MGAVHSGMSRTKTFAGYSDLEVEVCAGCGVLFAAPKQLLDAAREDGDSFYCPNGHSLSYDSENARLKKQLARAKDTLASVRADRDQVEASLRATRGVVTKQKKKLGRVAHGVCPCCNRTFRDLKRHMKAKHPDFETESATTP